MSQRFKDLMQQVDSGPGGCMWCNRMFQVYYLDMQDQAAEANANDHDSIRKRLNYLTGAVFLLVLILTARDILRLEDLQQVRNLVGVIITGIQVYQNG